MNKVLAVTLARGGSKGVPGKHTRDLCGKPVIAWTIAEVQKCPSVDKYVVSSDDAEILKIARKMGAQAIRRPNELALDTTPTLPALQYSVYVAELERHFKYDYIVEVRATSPLKTAEDIEACIDLLERTDADSVIGVCPLEDHHPARAKWLDRDGYIYDFIPEPASGRRQDCQPPAYIRNGTVYALRREWVMGANAKLFGHPKSIGYVMPQERSVNIDTELDFKLCQLLMQGRAQ